MTASEVAALMRQIAPVMRDFVAVSTAPLIARIAELEAREVRAMLPREMPSEPIDVEGVVSAEVERRMGEIVQRAAAAVPPVEPPAAPELPDIAGMITAEVDKRADDIIMAAAALVPPPDVPEPPDIQSAVDEAVAIAFAALPRPQNGKDADPEVIAACVRAEVADAVAALPAAAPGKDADPEETRALVAAEVERAVAALPRPQDGKSVDMEVVARMVVEEVAKLPPARDGVGLASALIDRDGNLVLTLTDGATRELGRVVGKDADQADVVRMIAAEVDKFPRPKDGLDGLGVDNLDVVYDGERTFTFRWSAGERVEERSFVVPVALDRGVFKSETTYAPGDGVTYGGAWWIAQRSTTERPDGPATGWRLAVKAGRAGKDGKDGERGPPGPKGEAGRDLTQLGPDGSKWR